MDGDFLHVYKVNFTFFFKTQGLASVLLLFNFFSDVSTEKMCLHKYIDRNEMSYVTSNSPSVSCSR